MFYVIIHIYDDKYLEDIVLALTSSGIHDAVIVSGEMLTSYLKNAHVSLFTDMVLGYNPRKYSKIVSFIAKEKTQIESLKIWIKEAEVDENEIDIIVLEGKEVL